MNNERWVVDGKVGAAWIICDANRTDLLAPRIRVYGSIKLALRVAELLNTFGSNA
jgi:hypothetical protein